MRREWMGVAGNGTEVRVLVEIAEAGKLYDAMVGELARRAVRSKARKAKALGGAVVVTVIGCDTSKKIGGKS
jgi:hypothetical protein